METTPLAPFRPARRKVAGFTVVEVIFAATLLAMFVCVSVVALVQINRWATAARLRTLALAVAQQQIDQVQTAKWQSGVPEGVLALGKREETDLPLNNDDLNAATGLRSAFTGLDTLVTAKRTTEVSNVIATRTVRAVVTVSFEYRKRTYNLSLTTLRAVDSI